MEIIFVVIIAVGILTIIGGFLMYYLNKSSWRYQFHLATATGLKSIKAKKISSKSNKSQRFFIFQNNDTKLHIKEPNFSFNNKPTRLITYGPTGDYVYVDKTEINKDKYLQFSLEPEERELALWRFQENQKQYGSIDKTQVAFMFMTIALVVVISIAVIYSVISFTKNADLFGEISKNNRETISDMNGFVTAMERISEYQLLVMQSLNSEVIGEDIVRTIS